MADIFGRQPGDYKIVRELHKRGEWEAYQAQNSSIRYGNAQVRHDFDALGKGWSVKERASEDASGTGFLTSNLLAIQTMVDEYMFTRFRLPEFVAINTNIPEGAESYGVRVRNRVGKARRISAAGEDVPKATAGETIVTRPVHWYGLDAEWSIDELRGAMFGGFPLDNEAIDAAVRGSLETMEEVALIGEAQSGFTTGDTTVRGLLTLDTSTVTQRAVASAFASSTATVIRNEINAELSSMIENSREVIGKTPPLDTGMTVYLPGVEYDRLTTLYIGDNAERTLMDSILSDNPWTHFTDGRPLNIARVIELAAARNPHLTQNRMVTSLMNSRIAEMGVPIMPRVLDVVNKGRAVCAMVESKYSDLFVKRPKQIQYVDNV